MHFNSLATTIMSITYSRCIFIKHEEDNTSGFMERKKERKVRSLMKVKWWLSQKSYSKYATSDRKCTLSPDLLAHQRSALRISSIMPANDTEINIPTLQTLISGEEKVAKGWTAVH